MADVEIKIRELMAGNGLIDSPPPGSLDPDVPYPHGGLSADLDVLTAYLSLLIAPRNPNPAASDLVQRGFEVFTLRGCTVCHVGPAATNLQSFDVGTGLSALERRGTRFDTPSLRWLWLSAPYFHDGSASTLHEVFQLPGLHRLAGNTPPEDIDALVAYLLSLPN